MPKEPMTRNTLQSTLAVWERLLAGAAANQDDLPALEQYRAELESAVAELKASHARRLSHQAEALQETQKLHGLTRRGRDLAAQFQSGVRLLFGRRSPKLSELGMKVLGPRTKARGKAGPGCAVRGCPLEATTTGK
ncbi:MAG: hypothetical protein ACJ76Y_20575 [Thermoanaerobaculia bacterium]